MATITEMQRLFGEERINELLEAGRSGDFEAIKTLADYGHPPAVLFMGNAYYNGENGVSQDLDKAVFFYKKGAELNGPSCCCNLGLCYMMGHAVEKNYQKAVEMFKEGEALIMQDDDEDYRKTAATTQINIACCFGEGGFGLEQSSEKAAQWWKKAAQLGNPRAQFTFGLLCVKGDGVEKNIDLAREWLTKSARSGYDSAETLLNLLPLIGKWRWTTVTYEFRYNGTYSYINTDSGKQVDGNYMVSDGNKVSFLGVGTFDRFVIQGDSLTFEDVRGVTFRRI